MRYRSSMYMIPYNIYRINITHEIILNNNIKFVFICSVYIIDILKLCFDLYARYTE